MSYFPPLGLCYIANILEKNCIKVKIIDRNALMTKHGGDYCRVNEITKDNIRKFSPQLVGITSTTATFYDVRSNILKMVKSLNKDITIVLGGPHASALPEAILSKYEDIDIICRGEGEMTMLEIAQMKKLENISGITYRSGSGIQSNEEREPYKNIDEFCFPARYLVDMKFYCKANPYIMHGLYMRATTLFTSRGCAFDCTFCAGKVAVGRRVRLQSPALVIEEIERLIKDYNVEGIYFADDMFDINKQRADMICEELIRKGIHKKIKWYPQLRANSIEKKRVELMKRAGAVRADIGFESGSQRTLDTINKKTTVEQNYNAARILHEARLQFQANTIVGIPGEDEHDIKQTEAMLRKIKPHWIGFGEFIPLPGSRLYNEMIKKGLLDADNMEAIGTFNFTKLDNTTFEALISRIRNNIVIPTRIKSYLMYNLQKPKAYLFLAKLVGETLKEYGKKQLARWTEAQCALDEMQKNK